MIIKNFNKLAKSENRKIILKMIEAGISRVHPHNLIGNSLRYNQNFNSLIIQNNTHDVLGGRIFVVGSGKASGYMAEAVENIIGQKNIKAGIVNSDDSDYKTKKIKIISAGHPLPDRKSVSGAKKMLDLKVKYSINKKDVVLCLISGGSSSMLACPVDTISLAEYRKTTRLLIESGADIREINSVRKHISRVKGGNLAEFFSPAKVISMIISDVVGDDLSVIGSGPTVPDMSTFNDAKTILIGHNLWNKIPNTVQKYIDLGTRGEKKENPKIILNAVNYTIGTSSMALEEMALCAKSYGLKPIIISNKVKGDIKSEAKIMAQNIIKRKSGQYNVLLMSGETTIKLPQGYGKGGRNQHFGAEIFSNLSNFNEKWSFASICSDGVDYLDDTAGVIIDSDDVMIARKKNLSIEKYIEKYNSNVFFKKLGNSIIKTGKTGTNIGDIVVCVI